MRPKHSKNSQNDPTTRRPHRDDEGQGLRALFTAIGVCVAVGGALVAWLGAGRREEAARRARSTDTSAPPASARRPAATSARRPAAPAKPATNDAAPDNAETGDAATRDGTSYGPNGSSQGAETATTQAADADATVAASRPHTPGATDVAPTAVFHLVPGDTGWQLRREGDETPIERFPTKKAGLDAARRLAREREPSRLVVHRVDGTIQNQFSYGDR
ncbi:MAG: DUF2188 domain-containing protein [Acidobacteriota bacterium]